MIIEQPTVEALAHSPDRAGVRIGVSTRAVYVHIASGELKSFKIGRRRLILEDELKAFVARNAACK
jgi:excisionase family DNA binding protein